MTSLPMAKRILRQELTLVTGSEADARWGSRCEPLQPLRTVTYLPSAMKVA